MKVLNIHNRHAHPGGMEVLFAALTNLLRARGHEVITLEKDNADLRGALSKLTAFGSMIHSPATRRELRELIREHRPDVASVFNLYPQLSVSALDALREEGVPVVMHVQDYKLTCPTAQHLRNGSICNKCTGGREYWCALHNCRGSVPMSVAYATRNAFARISGKIARGVTLYACCTRFVARRIIDGGYPAERVAVIPNFCDLPDAPRRTSAGEYTAYVGRISPEKGLPVLIEAARRTGIPTKIAGDPSLMPELRRDLPGNVELVGRLSREALPEFLARARCLVVPSVWYEAFGIVAAEAMSRGLPVIASDIGGLGEVVDHEMNGLLVPAGDADALAAAMRRLHGDDLLCLQLGEAGRAKVEAEYSPDAFYARLMALYERARDLSGVADATTLSGPREAREAPVTDS